MSKTIPTVVVANLPPIINGDPAGEYFKNLTTTPINTSSDKNSILIAFFEEWTGSTEAGRQLAAVILYTAKQQNVDVMELLPQFEGLNKYQLSAYLALFINLNRVNTSLLGISNSPQPNKYVSRAILP